MKKAKNLITIVLSLLLVNYSYSQTEKKTFSYPTFCVYLDSVIHLNTYDSLKGQEKYEMKHKFMYSISVNDGIVTVLNFGNKDHLF
jgi:hypothetical protein